MGKGGRKGRRNARELAPCGTQGCVFSPVRQRRGTVLCTGGGGKGRRRERDDKEEEKKKNGRIK